ncbi:helix-turn-helix domain-containing protein [Streptosporangium sp. NPDC051022]|uniref:helix-turn-helix domain-containing protein n=1 Tax=Streptosporangium sp. NPDC051022 TaxID=3155752 RepID=UPI00343E0869
MPPNERLRSALLAAGISAQQLAEEVGVDPKTVERWVNTGRTPHPNIAHRAAVVLREDLAHLWPAIERGRRRSQGSGELVAAYPTRSSAPLDMWRILFERAERRVGILVYAANFLHESWPDFNDLLAAKARQGCRVRVLLGDADSPVIRGRGAEERFGHGIESRCRVALMHYRPLVTSAGVELRVHATTLYNSLFVGDDQMIVNAHVYGMNAYGAPVYHLRRMRDDGLFDTYATSFEAVWEQSRLPGEDE